MKDKIYPIIGITLFLIGASFYWFAYRPSRIKHDCSWVRKITVAVPAQPEITKQDVEASQIAHDKCMIKTHPGRLFDGLECDLILKQERAMIPAKPAAEWYREAWTSEYDFCIHEKGL